MFGKNQLGRLSELLKAQNANKILITFGGGSIKTNGLLEKILIELIRVVLTIFLIFYISKFLKFLIQKSYI